MKNKGFSLLEIIFSLLIISILLTIGTTYFQDTLSNSKKVELKNDILKIQLGINTYKNNNLLKNEDPTLYELEENENELFSNILQTPIKSSYDGWEKIDSNKYIYHINNINLEFTYDTDNYLFLCDTTIELCKEIIE